MAIACYAEMGSRGYERLRWTKRNERQETPASVITDQQKLKLNKLSALVNLSGSGAPHL